MIVGATEQTDRAPYDPGAARAVPGSDSAGFALVPVDDPVDLRLVRVVVSECGLGSGEVDAELA
jgi:hypothetical protein